MISNPLDDSFNLSHVFVDAESDLVSSQRKLGGKPKRRLRKLGKKESAAYSNSIGSLFCSFSDLFSSSNMSMSTNSIDDEDINKDTSLLQLRPSGRKELEQEKGLRGSNKGIRVRSHRGRATETEKRRGEQRRGDGSVLTTSHRHNEDGSGQLSRHRGYALPRRPEHIRKMLTDEKVPSSDEHRPRHPNKNKTRSSRSSTTPRERSASRTRSPGKPKRHTSGKKDLRSHGSVSPSDNQDCDKDIVVTYDMPFGLDAGPASPSRSARPVRGSSLRTKSALVARKSSRKERRDSDDLSVSIQRCCSTPSSKRTRVSPRKPSSAARKFGKDKREDDLSAFIHGSSPTSSPKRTKSPRKSREDNLNSTLHGGSVSNTPPAQTAPRQPRRRGSLDSRE